jgi:hypothetical protein
MKASPDMLPPRQNEFAQTYHNGIDLSRLNFSVKGSCVTRTALLIQTPMQPCFDAKNLLWEGLKTAISEVIQIIGMPSIPDQWLGIILLVLYQKPTITRDDIGRGTGLNPASVSQALQHLLSSGTIVKVGEMKSRGGRRRELLELNPEAGYFIAVDLEVAHPLCAANLVGDIRYRWEQEQDFGLGVSVSDLLRGLAMVQRNLAKWQSARLLAVGISCPGIIQEEGMVTAVNLGWRRFLLAEKAERCHFAPAVPWIPHVAATCWPSAGWAVPGAATVASSSRWEEA